MPATLTRVLFVASCAAILFSGWLGYADLPWGFEAREGHPSWVGRYDSLSAPLAGEPEAVYIQEQRQGGSHRYFRAQFVLLPVIVQRRPGIESIDFRQLENTPVILDFHSKKGLRDTLRSLTSAAQEAGFELEVERGRGHLALARARRATT